MTQDIALAFKAVWLLEGPRLSQRMVGSNVTHAFPELIAVDTIRNLVLPREVVDIQGNRITQVVLFEGRRTAVKGSAHVYISAPAEVKQLHAFFTQLGSGEHVQKGGELLLVSPTFHADTPHEEGIDRAALTELQLLSWDRKR